MINRDRAALMDLFNHVIAGRANIAEINALIGYLNEQKAALSAQQISQAELLPDDPFDRLLALDDFYDTPDGSL